MNLSKLPQVFIATCGAWWLRKTAKSFEERDALAAMWCTEKNLPRVSPTRFKRCYPFHLAMKPLYTFASQIVIERMFYANFPFWKFWAQSQSMPACDVMHSIMGYGTEFFDRLPAGRKVLKVADAPNSHPMSYYGFWQRECDIWCPGEKVPIPQWMFARMNRELERADMVIVQSKYCKESMVMNGIPPEKVMINVMGVDTSIFKKRETVPAKPRFVCVGTICLRKGHQYLFRAFQKVKKVLPEAELICIGQYKTDFRKERLKWEGTFTHHPRLSHQEISDLFQNCTAFAFPSQEEGIARAQIEALASGLPVIGTHPGGATTVVDDGVEGFIVRERDPEHIAQAMLRIAKDRELCGRMGDAAYRRGAVRNTWQDYGDRLLVEYEERLGGMKSTESK